MDIQKSLITRKLEIFLKKNTIQFKIVNVVKIFFD